MDRFFAPRVAMVFVLLPLAGLLGMVLLPVGSWSIGCMVLIATGLGAEIDLIGYLQSRYLGTLAFGQVFGWLFATATLSGGLGTMLMGFSFDLTGSYAAAAFVAAASLATSCTVLATFGTYRFPPPGA